MATSIELNEKTLIKITKSDLQNYAWASGDINPIHFDEQKAKDMGLPGVIAHGLFVHSLMLNFVEDVLEKKSPNSKITKSKTSFSGMVLVPCSVELSLSKSSEAKFVVELSSADKPELKLVSIELQLSE